MHMPTAPANRLLRRVTRPRRVMLWHRGYPPAQPYASPTGPLSGAASGSAAGAQSGGAAAGPVGAIVGGALGTATGAVQGTANMLTPPGMRCDAGYTYYTGACVPAR